VLVASNWLQITPKFSRYQRNNGVTHTLTQNLRGLPEMNRDAGVMQDVYAYDANGNVASITDQQEGVFSRSMGYDGLDRLTSANAPAVWGSANYTYDAADNLRSATVGSRSVTMNFNGNNQLASVTTNGGTALYGFDARGNLTAKGAQSFGFDLGNRLSWSSLGGQLRLRRSRAAIQDRQQ
jgi:YD repeat-containing protein